MVTLRADKSSKAKKERTPRAQWLAAHPQERTAPWKKMGISRRKFFKDKKAAREAAERERRRREARRQKVREWINTRQVRRSTVEIPIQMIERNTYYALVFSYIMRRGKKSMPVMSFRTKRRLGQRGRGP